MLMLRLSMAGDELAPKSLKMQPAGHLGRKQLRRKGEGRGSCLMTGDARGKGDMRGG